jgi:hypothetical protein
MDWIELRDNVKLIDEETETPWFESPLFVSYEEWETKCPYVLLYYDGELKGKIEVYTDVSHETRMETKTAEYIILNNTMYYLSDLEEEIDCECITTDMGGKCTHCLRGPRDETYITMDETYITIENKSPPKRRFGRQNI